ncbi:Transposable element P transposase, partial [Stegodyphus mimosarum]
MFYLLSPQAYKFVRQSGNLILPHPSTIHKISSKLNVNPQKEADDMLFLAYAKQKACYLKEHELYVSLMMDEIHIRPFLDYKSGDIVGIGQEVDNLASSAHVFMIQSILCSFKDVVHILPSKKMTAEVLFTVLKKVIVGLEGIGFKVIVVVSDNNSINRRCISLFNNPLSNFVFPHPVDATRPLFYAVDPVHIIKSVRNNWLNQKNPEQAMYFPNFDLSSNNVCTSSFLTLKNMYEAESGNLLKYGYTISRKALWPTNLERQSVKLALQIFNQQVSQGLKELGVKHNLLKFHETSAYIKIFSSWFSIMNVKTPNKGVHSCDEFCKPLVWNESDRKFVFLNNFLDWLIKWKDMKSDTGRLTKETLSALILTTTCMIELCRYCIGELNMSYFLPGKIQTDELEHRFSLYRRMAGTH